MFSSHQRWMSPLSCSGEWLRYHGSTSDIASHCLKKTYDGTGELETGKTNGDCISLIKTVGVHSHSRIRMAMFVKKDSLELMNLHHNLLLRFHNRAGGKSDAKAVAVAGTGAFDLFSGDSHYGGGSLIVGGQIESERPHP
jgi:hypothetical protein